MSASRPVARGYHHGNLRVALQEAAVALVRDNGAHGFTLADAARHVGVSVAAPYRHFESREELLAEVARWGFARLGERLVASAADSTDDDVIDQLVRLGCAYVEFAGTEPEIFRLMFSLQDRDPAVEAGRSALAVLSDCVERAAHSGKIQVEPAVATRATWALAHGLAMLRIGQMETFRTAGDQAVEETLRLLIKGLVPVGGSASSSSRSG